MSRSQLLMDLVSEKTSLESILLRLKVILSDFEKESIINWVNGELEGFEKENVPSYRILKGIPRGTFIINYNIQYTNQLVPIRTLLSDESIIESIITLDVTDSITAIQSSITSDREANIKKPISTDFCHSISKDSLQLAAMHVEFSTMQFDGIISKVKSKLIEIIMELEKNFIDLDDLDIKPQIEGNDDKKEVIYNIQNIIYDDSITVGDNNELQKSSIGNFFRKK